MAIKRGVSFYSFQESYFRGQYNLEDLIRLTSEVVGAEGIEILAEATPVGSFPDPSDADVDRWFGWMDKYKTKPTCMDSFIDYQMFKGRTLTLKEQVMQMERDLRLSARLGFTVMRVLCPVRKEIVEASIPYAEKYNVRMGVEIHSPMMLHSEWMEEYYEMFDRTGSKHVGIVVDFGCFQRKPPRKAVLNAIEQGGKQKILNYIVESCENMIPITEIIEAIKKMGAGAPEMELAQSFFRSRYSDPEHLRDVFKYILHFHGKFAEMDEDCHETSFDYEKPIRILKESGYDGYINSEYEGHKLYIEPEEADELEQVRRHHIMLRRLIG